MSLEPDLAIGFIFAPQTMAISRKRCCWAALSLFAVYSLVNVVRQQWIEEQRSSYKTILLWNAPQRTESILFGTGHEAFTANECPVSDCELVNSRYGHRNLSLDSYDAIVFNLNDQYATAMQRPQFHRQPHQRFVLMTQEAPPALDHYDFRRYDGFFNWTMSYRRDSDVKFLYGRVHRTALNSAPVEPTPLKDRKGAVAMISHCNTHGRRELYVRQLKQHFPVDVFGQQYERCRGLSVRTLGGPCARDDIVTSPTSDCYRVLESRYKFYLSFENAICADYVTEKFFNILQTNMVPVVYGGANYSAVAPPRSFIDARQFSPKQLADYLTRLGNNDEEYLRYFDWKSHYKVEAGIEQMSRHGFCDLCAKLHDESTDLERHYSSEELIAQWDDGSCHRPTVMRPNPSPDNSTIKSLYL